MPLDSVRDEFAAKTAPEGAQTSLNTVDIFSKDYAATATTGRGDAMRRPHSAPANITLSAIAATEAGTITKLLLDKHIYKDYGGLTGNALVSKNPFTQAPEWINKGQSPWLEKQFQTSSATAVAREASQKYLAENLARAGMNEAALKGVEASTKMLNVLGRSGTEMILGPGSTAHSTASMKAALLKLDPAKLKGLGEIEFGLVNEARELALFEAKLANTLAQNTGAARNAAILARPDLAAQGRTVGIGIRDGAIAIGANLALDAAAKSVADYLCGPNSEASNLMETNALGLGLSTFGYIAGADRRSKLAYAGAGWLAGKALNYLGSETVTLQRAKFDPIFKDNQKISDLIEKYGDRQLSR